MLDETDIQKLLRLKRHEQPPAGYHEKFLQDFHRRQRSEMLQQPVWKIALERMGAFFSERSVGSFGYGMATAAVLAFAGIASFEMLNGGGPLQVAKVNPPISSQPVAVVTPSSDFNLKGLAHQQNATLPEPASMGVTNPHYVIDSRPVSYERPFSF